MPRPTTNLQSPIYSTDPSKRRIFVLDDELQLRTVLAMELRRDGFVVETGSSPQIALVEPHLARCDAYVVDLRLRGSMDGEAFVAELRRRKPSAVVLFISGDQEAVAALHARGELALAKPIAYGEIGRQLRARLGNGA